MKRTRIRRPCPALRHRPNHEVFWVNQRNWFFHLANGYAVSLCRGPLVHGLEAAIMIPDGNDYAFARGHGEEWFDRDGICRVDSIMVDDLLDYVEALPSQGYFS